MGIPRCERGERRQVPKIRSGKWSNTGSPKKDEQNRISQSEVSSAPRTTQDVQQVFSFYFAPTPCRPGPRLCGCIWTLPVSCPKQHRLLASPAFCLHRPPSLPPSPPAATTCTDLFFWVAGFWRPYLLKCVRLAPPRDRDNCRHRCKRGPDFWT